MQPQDCSSLCPNMGQGGIWTGQDRTPSLAGRVGGAHAKSLIAAVDLILYMHTGWVAAMLTRIATIEELEAVMCAHIQIIELSAHSDMVEIGMTWGRTYAGPSVCWCESCCTCTWCESSQWERGQSCESVVSWLAHAFSSRSVYSESKWALQCRKIASTSACCFTDTGSFAFIVNWLLNGETMYIYNNKQCKYHPSSLS